MWDIFGNFLTLWAFFGNFQTFWDFLRICKHCEHFFGNFKHCEIFLAISKIVRLFCFFLKYCETLLVILKHCVWHINWNEFNLRRFWLKNIKAAKSFAKQRIIIISHADHIHKLSRFNHRSIHYLWNAFGIHFCTSHSLLLRI